MLSVLIIMNNYFHDVATALLVSSAVILYVLQRNAEKNGTAERLAFAHAYPLLTKFAWGAIAWIVIGGIPRTIFFTRYEWDPALVKGIVPALLVKHTLIAVAVIIGSILWIRLARSAKAYLAQAEGHAESA